jgi:hypothetical protein
MIEASHEPIVKLHHILLPPSDSTYKYQKVSPFAIHRKNITTSIGIPKLDRIPNQYAKKKGKRDQTGEGRV